MAVIFNVTNADKKPWRHLASLGHNNYFHDHLRVLTSSPSWIQLPGHVIHHHRKIPQGKTTRKKTQLQHFMRTHHHINILSTLLALNAGIWEDSQHKGPIMQSFDGFFVASLDKLLNKQLWWLKWHTLKWTCDVTAMFLGAQLLQNMKLILTHQPLKNLTEIFGNDVQANFSD